ncbi:Fe(3+)-hydroxamate ABC transporter permease FhuB [Vibrio sp. 10N]|nr:Fe(3+)-hydroxamate ABC transporter permease FhuB [Vibrio sp. 10N]
MVAQAMFDSVWLPTALMAIMIGALHASSGLLIQVSLNNEFASPSTLGIASGALLGAVLAQILFPQSGFVVVWAGALVGALLLSGIVMAVSRLVGGGQLAIILVGMALGLGAGAVSSVLLLYFENQTDGLFLWGSGQVLQTSISPVATYSPIIGLLLLATLLVLPKLSLFLLGDTHASSLGVAVSRWRWCILTLAIAQASLATALVGLVAFVGLMAPHIARALYMRANENRSIWLLWLLSVLVGASLVLIAEWCSRGMLVIGYRLPTGVFTALIGAPFFISLLLRRRGQVASASDQHGLTLSPFVHLKPKKTLFLLTLAFVFSAHFWGHSNHYYGSNDGLLGYWDNLRVLLASVAGVGLACAGVILQTLFRNPMASPDISGVSAFSVLIIACVLVVEPSASQIVLTLASLAGAVLVLAMLSWGLKQQLSVAQLALFGIVISAFAGTATHILLTFGSSTTSVTLMWLSGTTYGASIDKLVPFFGVVIGLCVALIPLLRSLDVLSLGEQLPVALGVPIAKHRLWLLAIAAGLTAISIAHVGAISFVGLLAPHCARMMGLYRHQHLLPAAALIGATLMVWADGLGRTLTAPNEIAAGLMVSILGSVYFLILILVGYRKYQYART